MKNPFIQLSPYLLLLLLIACSKDPAGPVEPLEYGVLQFSEKNLFFGENDKKQLITLYLSEAFSRDLEVKLDVTSSSPGLIATTPAIHDNKLNLILPKGKKEIAFEVQPIDNNDLNDSQEVIFRIGALPTGVSAGANQELKLRLIDDEGPVWVNFDEYALTLLENDGERSILLSLSGKAMGAGMLELSYTSNHANYGYHFTTVPEGNNGKIVLPVEPGAESVRFKIIPINNQEIEGKLEINFRMEAANGSVALGQQLTHKITIEDDELHGMSRGYTTSGGSWKSQRFFSYLPNGKVEKILWRSYTPYLTQGHYTYQYDGQGKLQRSISSDRTETSYIYKNDQIIRAETYRDGVLKELVHYGYDQAGNVAEALYLYRQPGGEMKEGLLFVYLYHTSGNLYKQMAFQPVPNAEPIPISTKTYENYSNRPNPFPIEVLPNISAQPNLPGRYTVEENGVTLRFDFTYAFDAEGRPTKRDATSSTGSEQSVYHYLD